MNSPNHIRRDAAQLAFARTLSEITRIAETFGADTLPIAAFASMKAAFLALHTALSTINPEFTEEALIKSWASTMMEELKNERTH